MTAPGSGTATSGGGCTKETPCFVCQLKATVAAQGVGAKWDDAPFALNLVGIRLSRSISDKFDDRMIAFFSLPADESSKALKDGGIEAELVDDLAKAADACNGAHAELLGHGVRRVPCSAVELEPGKPAAGHRVVAMFPITTDPGLVRPVSQKQELDNAIAASKVKLDKLEAAKKSYVDKLKKDLDAARDKLKGLPVPKRGEAKSKERLDAEKAVVDAQAAIDKLALEVKWRPVTVERIDAMIKAEKDNKAALEGRSADWSKPDLTKKETQEFEGYHGAFLTELGMEGDDHALFPVGHHASHFTFYLHHWSRPGAAPALTVGEFLGGRVMTGKTLKEVFHKLVEFPRWKRLGPVNDAQKARSAALKAAFKAEKDALPAQKEAMPKGADAATVAAIKARNAKLDADLKASQDQRKAATDAQNQRETIAATEEYLLLRQVRKTSTAPPPAAGAWVVQGCKVKTPAGEAPLADDDVFELAVVGPTTWTGREARLHYHDRIGKADGLAIAKHTPAGGRAALPAGSKIVASEVMFEEGGKLRPVRDDDQIEVEGMIGGTNVHRGHTIKVDGDAVNVKYESLDKVHNWSTGCQVYPLFADFNLFILLAGLSKRWRCLQSKQPGDCARIEAGSADKPNAFVWSNGQISPAFPPSSLKDQIKADGAALQKELAKAKADAAAKVDAFYKSHKGEARPPKAPDAEAHAVAWYAAQVAALAATPEKKAPIEAEQKALLDAVAAREGAARRASELAAVDGQLHLKRAPYSEVDADITALCKALDDDLARLSDAPEAKKAAEEGKKAALQARADHKAEAHERAVVMRHDWMRKCDLGASCPKRYSYTLIELAAGDATRDVRSLSHLDAEFGKKVGGAEVYPKWKGFGAT